MKAREYRCCMCPQINVGRCICPSGPGKSEETQCNFVLIWMDTCERKYKVMGDPSGTYKAYYQDDKQKGDIGWKEMQHMEPRKSFDNAQEDLNRYAIRKGWHNVMM